MYNILDFYQSVFFYIIFFLSPIFQDTCEQGMLYGTPCTCLALSLIETFNNTLRSRLYKKPGTIIQGCEKRDKSF